MTNSFKTNSKRIDVIIPTFNHEKYILNAVKSIEAQTYRPEKIIIVDDGSTDNTENLVKGYKSKLPIKYIKQPNGGLSSARNTGIKNSDAPYLAFLDSDDQWYPNKLNKQIELFNSHDPALGVVYGNFNIIDNKNDIDQTYIQHQLDTNNKGNIYSQLLLGNIVSGSGSCVLIKRDCFDYAGLFDETLSACEDWDMWLRIAEKFEFNYVNEIIVSIRRHTSNMQKDKSHMFSNTLKFYKKQALTLKDTRVLDYWGATIVDGIIESLPNTQLLKLVNSNLDKTAKDKLFRHKNGSVSKFVIARLLLLIYWAFKHSIKLLYRNSIKIFAVIFNK